MAAGREGRICFSDSTDRISELPQPLLQHMLCFLTQKEAVQTCVLSKSWRCLGPTRPKLEFLYEDYLSKQTDFRSILDKTLQMYHDQKLCLQEFHVEFYATDPETVEFLEKLFPLIVMAMGGVKNFHLSFRWRGLVRFALPWELFENSKSLRNLRLCGLRFSKNLSMDKVHHLKHLQTLSLRFVDIVDDTFQKIMSSCRHIEHVVLDRCEGLTTIRLTNNSRLKSFELHCSGEYRLNLKEDVCLVDVPSLESMIIDSCDNWFSFDRKTHFPALKSLHLMHLQLPKLPSLDIFPCLQSLKIHDCSGFDELRVSSRFIKHLTFSCLKYSNKVIFVDAQNLVLLDFSGPPPVDICFATISNERTSHFEPFSLKVRYENGFQGLSKMLKAVRHSNIYLKLPYHEFVRDEDDNGYKAVPVEYVHLDFHVHGYFYSEDFLNHMFRYCRPRNIMERECTKRSEFLCKILLLRHNNGIGSPCFYWQQDLEEASMRVWDQNSQEWHPVEGTTFLESARAHRSPTCHEYCSNDSSKHYEVLFELKWRQSQSN